MRADNDRADAAQDLAAEHPEERGLRGWPLGGLRSQDARAVWLRVCEAEGLHVGLRTSSLAQRSGIRQSGSSVLVELRRSEDKAPSASRDDGRAGDCVSADKDARDKAHRESSGADRHPRSAPESHVRQVPGADVARSAAQGQRISRVDSETGRLRR